MSNFMEFRLIFWNLTWLKLQALLFTQGSMLTNNHVVSKQQVLCSNKRHNPRGVLTFYPVTSRWVWQVKHIKMNTHVQLESFGWKHFHLVAS